MKPYRFKKFVEELLKEDGEFFYEIVMYKGACLSDAERYAWVDWAKETISDKYDFQEEIVEEIILYIENYF